MLSIFEVWEGEGHFSSLWIQHISNLIKHALQEMTDIQPQQQPMHAHGCRYRFWWVQVEVDLGDLGVTWLHKPSEE